MKYLYIWLSIPIVLYIFISVLTLFALSSGKFMELNISFVRDYATGKIYEFFVYNYALLISLSMLLPLFLLYQFPKTRRFLPLFPLLFLPAIVLDLTSDIGVVFFHFSPLSIALVRWLYWW